MSNLLTQLTFGFTAAAAVGFYYLTAAPPALAQADVCGPGNFSDACLPDSKPVSPPSDTISNVYKNSAIQSSPSVSVPEPSTTIALLMTGAGIIYSAKKRKEIGQER